MSESKLRQSHQELRSQLADKDQLISQLQAQLQKQQEQIQHPQQQQQQQAQHVTLYSSSNKQTNFKVTSFLSFTTIFKTRDYFFYLYFLIKRPFLHFSRMLFLL